MPPKNAQPVTNSLATSSEVAAPTGAQDQLANLMRVEIAKIYIYRHLLRNIESSRRAIEKEQQERAPRITGPRAAALLARLWANQDLRLSPTPQKVLAHDLGLGESEVAKMLRVFRDARSGAACVTLVSPPHARESLYEISEAGKKELENWILAYSTHDSFQDLIRKIKPSMKNVSPMLAELRTEVRQRLRR